MACHHVSVTPQAGNPNACQLEQTSRGAATWGTHPNQRVTLEGLCSSKQWTRDPNAQFRLNVENANQVTEIKAYGCSSEGEVTRAEGSPGKGCA